jgi:hypothetical protein
MKLLSNIRSLASLANSYVVVGFALFKKLTLSFEESRVARGFDCSTEQLVTVSSCGPDLSTTFFMPLFFITCMLDDDDISYKTCVGTIKN